MIKSFNEFLNEAISYSKLTRFNVDEFISSGMEEVGVDVFAFLDEEKCILIDENGDEDEFEVFTRMQSIALDSQPDTNKNYEMSSNDFAVAYFFDKFPGIGKAVAVTRGETRFEAKGSENFMFFLPLSFRPDKFMQSTEGYKAGKQYGV
jgi:hypothetical protein